VSIETDPLRADWRGLAASGFLVEVWSWTGLLTFYALFVIDLSTRRVTVAGMTTNPNDAWMLQISRDLIDVESGPLRDKHFRVVDRDAKYSASFRQTLKREGIGIIRLPPRSPNLNAYAERSVRSVKEECLSKLTPVGPRILERYLREYVKHYHQERNHLGVGNRLTILTSTHHHVAQTIVRRTRLSGILTSISAARRSEGSFRT
jgi:putative transposase